MKMRLSLDGHLSFRCRNRWEALTPTEDSAVRHCGDCDHQVHWCDSDAALKALSKAGSCIAIDPEYLNLPAHSEPMVGRPLLPQDVPDCSSHGVYDAPPTRPSKANR